MEKDMMKKKFGLPPMPPIGPGNSSKKRQIMRKRDYTPVSWDKYFQSKKEVKTQIGDTFCVYESGTEGPVLVLLHGGGFSGLTWALMVSQLTLLVKCRCLAIDCRGHGDTVTSDDENLSADILSQDISNVLSTYYENEIPPVILVGHSMGGAIAVHTAVKGLIPSLIGLTVIDVVEGTAMDALTSMQSFLRSRPSKFDTIERAIEWAVRSGQIQNVDSAKVSMVGQLKNIESESDVNKETSSGLNDVIQEEDEEEQEGQQTSNTNTPPSKSEDVTNAGNAGQKLTWRVNLSRSEVFWKGWFQGLSQMFLSCSAPKMLILAGTDRLDKDLTIGQMQGKFQMNLLPQCGHAVHEDMPDRVADIMATFMLRHRVAEAI